MSERKPYPSDLSAEQWSLIEPVIAAWKDRHRSVSGHQGAYDMREIVNAILYQGRTGCPKHHFERTSTHEPSTEKNLSRIGPAGL